MTCDDFAKTSIPSTVATCKNLFLKDKKNRLIMVTTLADTKVDLKVLSARLGLGKGGLRMAPDELLGAVLQVPLGSVTTFALVQPSAEGVVLLLDEKIKAVDKLGLHPLVNTQTLAVTPSGLEKFLRSIGRQAVFINLEEEPVINAENPPDLKQYIDNAASFADAEGDGKEARADAPASKKDKKAAKAAGNKGGSAKGAPQQPAKDYSNVNLLVQDCMSMFTQKLQASDVSLEMSRSLQADLAVKLTALKNAAYTEGFMAARGAMSDYCQQKRSL